MTRPQSESASDLFYGKQAVFQLYHGDTTVLSGIAKHLTSILREKELGSLITNWLSAEASKPENINRAGTFR
jgi:hypothetical protein